MCDGSRPPLALPYREFDVNEYKTVSSLATADITISATSTSGDKLLCMSIATAPQASIHENSEWGCSGSGDPVAGACYEGSAGALGVTETVKVNLKKYSTGAGSMDLAGTGIKGFTCTDHSFTKSGQDVSADLSDCLPDGVTVPALKYCSDSDTIAVTVKDAAVPLPISTTLKKVTCASTAVTGNFVQGGALSLSWKDCGDASTKGTVSSLTPTSLTLGQNTKVTGAGSITEDVSGGQIVFGVKAGIISQSFPGDLCSPKTLTLPLGVGTVTYDGIKCPLAAGAVSVPVDIMLSSALPSSLATADITIGATSTSGDKLLCMAISTAPQASAHEDAEWGCSGSEDPAAGACYEGSAGALGVTETVKVNLKTYSTGAGSMDLTGTGIKGFTCTDHSFTKSGQDVSADLSDCLPDGVTVPALKYCSDSDTIAVTVKDAAVPLPISTTLKKVSCVSTIVV